MTLSMVAECYQLTHILSDSIITPVKTHGLRIIIPSAHVFIICCAMGKKLRVFT